MDTIADDVIELEIWKGDWGLPSIDQNCLAVLAYCKFSGVPVKVHRSGNPFRSPTNELPILHHKTATKTRLPDIFSYLRQHRWGSDYDLSHKQSADVLAFASLLEERLLPAILHLWFVDSKNYIEITRPWYSKAVPFPLNFYVPGWMHKKASEHVFMSKGSENLSENDIEGKIYKDAKECLNLLSYKLGKNEFFFGKSPSSLDALVFGYLAPLLKAPLQGCRLQNHLKGCDNLCEMCSRVLQRYFPPDPEDAEAQKQREEEEKRRQMDSMDFPHKKRNIILGGLFAVISMVCYAIFSGLISIRIVDDDDEEEEDGDGEERRDGPRVPANVDAFTPVFEDHQEDQPEWEEGET